ncbi:MAG: hypothetical protein OEQ29_16360, partial [Alphaproteobacteria bacterium]|nr:hypothetical protein [Alphaproteobacteria bacterium]
CICSVIAGAVFAVGPTAAVFADSSSPHLAAYYDRQMAIVGGAVYAWKGNRAPRKLPLKDVVQVGVGREYYYALTGSGTLLGFVEETPQLNVLMSGVAQFAAGRDGVLAIKADRTLWWIERRSGRKQKIASNVTTAAVGDGANYYISRTGGLFVKGKAHRGQYGDGRLRPTPNFIQTATDVRRITAHTGHAILMKTNGDVLGTGGNIYGPVGRHGLGNKAVRWSRIMSGARAIATGSSHTLAIRQDGTLFAWGRGYRPEPLRVMADVVAVAAGSRTTIAIRRDGSLWQWAPGDPPRRVLVR